MLGPQSSADYIRLTSVSQLNRLQGRTPETFNSYDFQQEYLIKLDGWPALGAVPNGPAPFGTVLH